MKKQKYKLKGKVFLWSGDKAAWHFLGIDKGPASEIRKNFGGIAKGFGSLPVQVTIGKTAWKTSIFPDSKNGTYLLPLKASVRKAEAIYAGDEVTFIVKVLPQ